MRFRPVLRYLYFEFFLTFTATRCGRGQTCRSKMVLLWKQMAEVALVTCRTWQWYNDPLSVEAAWFEWAARGARGGGARGGACEGHAHSQCAWGGTTRSSIISTLLEPCSFSSPTWIRPTTPEPRGVRNSTFLQLARTNFSPLPSAPSECSASAITLSSSYSTVDSRGCGRPPICFWST